MANTAVVYGREYDGNVYTLEASGGLVNASLVMMDRETDSYWSLMKSVVVAGPLQGLEIQELPLGEKSRWKEWRRKHPGTVVLSVDGLEDAPQGYQRYFESDEGFRGISASDERLDTKAPVYAFTFRGRKFAIAHADLAGGRSLEIEGTQFFFYRSAEAVMFQSTAAYSSTDGKFLLEEGRWRHLASGCEFDPVDGKFQSGAVVCPRRLEGGFDTFWYNWSLNNPQTELLIGK